MLTVKRQWQMAFPNQGGMRGAKLNPLRYLLSIIFPVVTVVLGVYFFSYHLAQLGPLSCDCTAGSGAHNTTQVLLEKWAAANASQSKARVDSALQLTSMGCKQNCSEYPGRHTAMKKFACEVFSKTCKRINDEAFWLSGNPAYESLLLPLPDPRSSILYTSPIEPEGGSVSQMLRSMDGAVPRIIHQAFFAPKQAANVKTVTPWLERADAMRTYGQQLNYTYLRWGLPDQAEELQSLMSPEMYELLKLEVSLEHLASAANLVRYVVLEKYGGVWIDLDYTVPSEPGTKEPIDLFDIFSLNGASFVPEGDCRNIEKGGIFVETSIILAPPHHPIIKRMIASQMQNYKRTVSVAITKHSGSFVQTGTMLFNKALFGKYTIVDRHTLDSIMVR